jgi:hypothetical protein
MEESEGNRPPAFRNLAHDAIAWWEGHRLLYTLVVQYLRLRGSPATWRIALFIPGTTLAAVLAFLCVALATLPAS